MAEPKVLVVMGSDSDFEIMKSCLKILKQFEIGFECKVCSAHRTPDEAANLAKNAIENGFDAIIAAAGKASTFAWCDSIYNSSYNRCSHR